MLDQENQRDLAGTQQKDKRPKTSDNLNFNPRRNGGPVQENGSATMNFGNKDQKFESSQSPTNDKTTQAAD